MALDILIDETNVTLATLSVELERATISHDVSNESSLYVTESGMFRFWVSLRAGSHFILLQSYVRFVEGLRYTECLDFCNRINERLLIPSFHVYRVESDDDGPEQFRLVGTYPILFRDGLMPSQFIRLCRQFLMGMERIETEFDPEHVRMRV